MVNKINSYVEIGKRVREARRRRCVSQLRLAMKCDPPMSQDKVSKIETGAQYPAIHDLCSIANALGIPYSYFLEPGQEDCIMANKTKQTSTGTAHVSDNKVLEKKRDRCADIEPGLMKKIEKLADSWTYSLHGEYSLDVYSIPPIVKGQEDLLAVAISEEFIDLKDEHDYWKIKPGDYSGRELVTRDTYLIISKDIVVQAALVVFSFSLQQLLTDGNAIWIEFDCEAGYLVDQFDFLRKKLGLPNSFEISYNAWEKLDDNESEKGRIWHTLG